MNLADHLAETEYISSADPSRIQQSPYGRLSLDERFPSRYDCNTLMDARIHKPDIDASLAFLDSAYTKKHLNFRRISWHKEDINCHLLLALGKRGWNLTHISMMLYEPRVREHPLPSSNLELHLLQKGEEEDLLKALCADEGRYQHYLHKNARLGGEFIIALVDGVPAGHTGFFIHQGVARYKAVYVAPEFRGQYIASHMLRYVQNHPLVQAQDVLTIHVDAKRGPMALYKSLGFKHHSYMWEAFLQL